MSYPIFQVGKVYKDSDGVEVTCVSNSGFVGFKKNQKTITYYTDQEGKTSYGRFVNPETIPDREKYEC